MTKKSDRVARQLEYWQALIQIAFERRLADVRALNGNFVICVPDHAEWTVVTQGSRPGLHLSPPPDQKIHFALYCEPELLGVVLVGESDLAPHLASGRIKMVGAVGLFGRFMAIAAEAAKAELQGDADAA